METNTMTHTQPQNNMLQRQLIFVMLATMLLMLMMQQAYAYIDTPMGAVLCNIVLMVYGNIGRGLASLAVIILGVGATLGKTSWGLAMTVGVGIALIFNAGPIVSSLGSTAQGCF